MTNNTHNIQAKGAVWNAVEKLMVAQWGRSNISRLARDSGIGLATISRLQADHQTSIGLDKVEKLAAVFQAPVWKLLDPNFDPSVGPEDLSLKAKALGCAYDAITDPISRERAYAMCLQVLELANPPHRLPSSPAEHTNAAAPERP